MLTLTKDIVIADSLYVQKIIFLPSLGHHSMDIIVGVNLGGLGQRSNHLLFRRFRSFAGGSLITAPAQLQATDAVVYTAHPNAPVVYTALCLRGITAL